MVEKTSVSVCILSYNHEHFIKECLENVLAQEISCDWEIIISDDCSTDNTRDIINKYRNKYPDLIKVIYPKINIGVIRSLISVLQSCTGKYIAFCEGDDYWNDPLKVSKQVEFLESHKDYSMVCTNRKILKIDNSVVEDKAYVKNIYTTDDILKGFIPGTQTIMIRNFPSLIDFLSKYHYIYSGDRYLSYFCSFLGNIYRMPESTATYRITGSGVWTQNSSLDKLLKVYDELEKFHLSIGLPLNNSILAEKSFQTSFAIFLYCSKRLKLLFQKKYFHYIFSPYSKFSKMNRFKYLCRSIYNRFKK